MIKFLSLIRGYKTYIAGIAGVIHGAIIMWGANGDQYLLNQGWMMVLGGLTAIFIRDAIPTGKK